MLSISHEPKPRRQIIILSASLGAVLGLVAAGWLFFMHTSAHPNIRAAAGRSKSPRAVIVDSHQPLPPYRLEGLDHQEIPTDELRRGRVLLVYLTTSCNPCIKEAEIISRLQPSVPSDVHIYGVYIESSAQVATFIKAFDLKFPALLDVDTQLAKSLDVHFFPSKYFLENGVITEIWHGTTQEEDKLRQHLNIK